MNNWSFTGYLGGDAEQRFTQSGESVVNFSVGVNSGYGEKQTTTWARCALWGKRGEAVAQYLAKGQPVGICGEVTLREYTDREGQKRSSLDVRVIDLTLLGKRDGGQSAPSRESSNNAPSPPKADGGSKAPTGDAFGDMADDIPF